MRWRDVAGARPVEVAAGTVLRVLICGVTASALLAGTVLAQVAPLGHPTIEQRVQALGMSPDQGFEFVVFGDQKNLWKNDFPVLLEQVRREMSSGNLLFMLDTGDIVDNGSRSAQFETLRGFLDGVPDLPYLVGVGNHELQPKSRNAARARAHQNTADFLGDAYAVDRMYFSRQIGPVRLIFLNTNDLPGVYPALYRRDSETEARATAQLRWLEEELQREVHPTVVLSHHALVQSPGKHRGHANALWNHAYTEHGGRTLPELLIDGGVDVVLSGHVHSYEVFELERAGRRMWSINASGRPTGLWRPGTRMPNDWQGREHERLLDEGFETRLEQWDITQLAFMTDDTKRDQFALFAVDADGNLRIDLRDLNGATLYELEIAAAR